MSAAGRLRAGILYGPHERNRFDLFLPTAPARGLVVFVHGGYWMMFDRSDWSHLARGPLEAGFAVAMPSYVLCPQARIAEITRQIGAAITAAAREVEGPIHLAGHSAGGHLVSRMACATTPLERPVLSRIRKTVSISGLHDLRPLALTSMNATLDIDADEALSESPALQAPAHGVDITFWVGGAERPEFVRQTLMMPDAWRKADARVDTVVEDGRHHFDVIEGLLDPKHRLVTTLLAL
jgi:acetyl esterase/lipase